MSQTVVDIPGLPADVEVRRSTRRRRSVTAYREGGRTIVVVPHRMSRADIKPFVDELVGRLQAREKRTRRTDAELHERALAISQRYLDGRAQPRSVRWVGNQRRRWGSCTPADATIRLSDRLAPMPAHVVDYVLLHELVHLLVPGHGPDFEAWMVRYPRLLEARAFLAGVDHATGHGLGEEPDGDDGGDDGAVDDGAEIVDGDHDDDPVAPSRDVAVDVTDAVRAPSVVRRQRPDPGAGAEPLF
jgi:predicted metal-dependent hydrolase